MKHNLSFKRYLILDLDETLIFNSKERICRDSIRLSEKYGFITLRPYLLEFLQEVQKHYNLILFTASESAYAEQILKILDPENKFFIIRLYKQNCVFIQNGVYLKLLSFLHNLDKQKCLFVDSAPFHLYENLDNGLPIIPFLGEEDDCELQKLAQFLREIKDESNYQTSLSTLFHLGSYRNCDNFPDFVEKMLST